MFGVQPNTTFEVSSKSLFLQNNNIIALEEKLIYLAILLDVAQTIDNV